MASTSSSSLPPKTSSKASYKKRKTTIKKKAEELSILCGVPVGLVFYDNDGKMETWPDDQNRVREIFMEYASKKGLILPSSTNNIGNPDLKTISKTKNLDHGDQEKIKKKKVYNTWDSRFDYMPEESLMEVLKVIESKEKNLQEKTNKKSVQGMIGKKRSRIQFNNEEDEEKLLTLRLGVGNSSIIKSRKK